MHIFTDYKNHEKITEPTALALGFFDGFHIGHIELLKYVKKTGLKTGVVTFSNSPASFIKKDSTSLCIMTNEDKIKFLENYGIDYLIMPAFDSEIMNMSKEDFIKFFLCAFNAKYVVSGFNFTFGKNKEGNTDNLPRLASAYNIMSYIIPAVKLNGEVVSSTLIRRALNDGDIEKVNKFLGRMFSVSGEVVSGKKIGRTLGFPTANISLPYEQLKPKWGVYHTIAEFDGKKYNSVTNIGNNPTVGGESVSVETYIIDFEGDIYGKNIKLSFISHIRDQVKFINKEELTKQIECDIAFVRGNYHEL